jgi:uncharacterized protein YkwD
LNLDLLSRRDALRTGLGLAALSVVSSCSTTLALAPAPAGPSADMTADALPLVNKARAAKGLPALFNDPVAANAARDQAINMARYGKMNHKLGSETFGERMHRMDVPLPAAENIASGQDSVERAVAAWIKSPKHYENMMGPYRGLGVALAKNAEDGRHYWAMVLSSSERGFLKGV